MRVQEKSVLTEPDVTLNSALAIEKKSSRCPYVYGLPRDSVTTPTGILPVSFLQGGLTNTAIFFLNLILVLFFAFTLEEGEDGRKSSQAGLPRSPAAPRSPRRPVSCGQSPYVFPYVRFLHVDGFLNRSWVLPTDSSPLDTRTGYIFWKECLHGTWVKRSRVRNAPCW